MFIKTIKQKSIDYHLLIPGIRLPNVIRNINFAGLACIDTYQYKYCALFSVPLCYSTVCLDMNILYVYAPVCRLMV